MVVSRVRQLGELAVPGVLVGATAGLVAGGLAALVGQPLGWAVVTALALGVPLALLGGGYGLLVGSGKVPIGVFAPVALYWLLGFPLARVAHEVTVGLAVTGQARLPEDLLGFLAYQGMVSLGWAIGFLWLHERIAPRWLHRVAEHNPPAAQLYARYAEHAGALWQAKQRRRASRSG